MSVAWESKALMSLVEGWECLTYTAHSYIRDALAYNTPMKRSLDLNSSWAHAVGESHLDILAACGA